MSVTDGTVRVFEVNFDLSGDRFQTLLIDGDDEFGRPWFELMSSPNPVTGGKLTTSIGGFDYASAVAIQPDGRIVVAGNDENDFALVRYPR